MKAERFSYLTPCMIWGQYRKLVIDLICYIVHKPPKTFTVIVFFKFQLFGDIAYWVAPNAGLSGVEIFLEVIIQPHLHHSHVVLKDETHNATT